LQKHLGFYFGRKINYTKVSPIQIQILLFCASHKQENLKVSFLANEFDLTKATISDSVKVLIKKEEFQIDCPDHKMTA